MGVPSPTIARRAAVCIRFIQKTTPGDGYSASVRNSYINLLALHKAAERIEKINTAKIIVSFQELFHESCYSQFL